MINYIMTLFIRETGGFSFNQQQQQHSEASFGGVTDWPRRQENGTLQPGKMDTRTEIIFGYFRLMMIMAISTFMVVLISLVFWNANGPKVQESLRVLFFPVSHHNEKLPLETNYS